MVEVFKTNVDNRDHAQWLVALIHKRFPHYQANFDLEDCDKILRVKSLKDIICPASLISVLKDLGFYAEVLPDEPINLNNLSPMAAGLFSSFFSSL